MRGFRGEDEDANTISEGKLGSSSTDLTEVTITVSEGNFGAPRLIRQNAATDRQKTE